MTTMELKSLKMDLVEELLSLNDKEMLFKYHQAKDPKNSSRIFTVELEDRQAWL